MNKPFGCPECLHAELIRNENEIHTLKEKFGKIAKIAGWQEYAIIKCDCKDGYSWRPIGHPDVKEYGAVEYCVV